MRYTKYTESTDLIDSMTRLNPHPRITNLHTVAESKLFRIESADLTFGNGAFRQYERLCHKKANTRSVMVVPINALHQFILVREFSMGTEKYEWNFPKGVVESHETIEQGAERELKEEAGIGFKKSTPLTTFAISPQYMQHKISVLLAQELYISKQEGDEPEEMEIVEMHSDTIIELIFKQQLVDVKTIAAFYMAQHVLKNGKKG